MATSAMLSGPGEVTGMLSWPPARGEAAPASFRDNARDMQGLALLLHPQSGTWSRAGASWAKRVPSEEMPHCEDLKMSQMRGERDGEPGLGSWSCAQRDGEVKGMRIQALEEQGLSSPEDVELNGFGMWS